VSIESNKPKLNNPFHICPLFLHAFSIQHLFDFRFPKSKVQNLNRKYRGLNLMSTFICWSKSEWHSSFLGWVLSYILHVFKVWHIVSHQLELTSLYQWHLWWTEQMWMNCCGFVHFFNTCCVPNTCLVIKFFNVDRDLMSGYHWLFIAYIILKILLMVPVKFTLTANLPRFTVSMQHFENLIKIQDNEHIFGSAWAN
jgi:hypothetical protein